MTYPNLELRRLVMEAKTALNEAYFAAQDDDFGKVLGRVESARHKLDDIEFEANRQNCKRRMRAVGDAIRASEREPESDPETETDFENLGQTGL